MVDALDRGHGVDVFRRHRLLQPEQAELLEVPGKPDGAVHVEAGVHVGRDVDARARRGRHHLDQADHAVVLELAGGRVERVLVEAGDLAAGMAVGVDIEVDLQRGEAAFEDVIDDPLDLVEVHAGLDLAIGIDADLVAELAAEEFVDRDLQRLPLEVEERDLDAGQRGDQRAGKAALEHQAAARLFEDRVDRERIAADQAGRQILDDGDRLVAAMNAFAQAGHTGVGFHPDPKVHAMPRGRRRLHCRDLHRLALPTATRTRWPRTAGFRKRRDVGLIPPPFRAIAFTSQGISAGGTRRLPEGGRPARHFAKSQPLGEENGGRGALPGYQPSAWAAIIHGL